MESIDELKKDERKLALYSWLLTTCGLQSFSMQAMVGDASFRRYFRIHHPKGTWVAMDAPPSKEKCAAFVAISDVLSKLGLFVPEVMASDLEQGFLLLSDLGDKTFLDVLNPKNAHDYYGRALQTLVKLQSCKNVPGIDLPVFEQGFMQQEWSWHKEWFLGRLLGLSLGQQETILDDCFAAISSEIAKQPRVFMHRDYHSANLMLLPSYDVGILDFQDAFIGPITYDLASLLRDCYISWPKEQVTQWVLGFYHRLVGGGYLAGIHQEEFLYWFDLTSVQRHLKALFTFARKQVRDGQTQYLQHVMRTLNYIVDTSKRYVETLSLHRFIIETIMPAWYKEAQRCAR